MVKIILSSLYEKSSLKQLSKKLKYAKEEYYSTLSPEAKEKLEHIKLKESMLVTKLYQPMESLQK